MANKPYVPTGPFPVGTFILKAGELTGLLSPHFARSEWFSNSEAKGFGYVPSHPIYAPLVAAAEILRTHFNKPWRITSTYRNEAHERYIIEHLMHKEYFISQHIKGKAFDSQPADNSQATLDAIAADFIAGGELYQKLRKAGITGFGLYDTFTHLDCRNDEFHAARHDDFGLVAWWDNRSGTKKTWGGVMLHPNATPTHRLAENSGQVLPPSA